MSCMAVDLPIPAVKELPHPALEGSGEKGGYSPSDLVSAYKLPSTGGSGQTIAIVDAYDDPNAESDLATYRSRYGLPACTTANGCFKKVNQKGEAANYPEGEPGWASEISLDLDMASAVCPECHLLLVESTNAAYTNINAAENKAAELGATEISNSFGSLEFASELEEDKYFNHPGIPITVSAGDSGYVAEWPAASRYVIAVGGTALRKDSGTRGWAEAVWAGTGSGCSQYETKPAWQKDAQCSKRMISDVAAVAAPETPVSVYDSYEAGGWLLFGGTSASAPIIAGVEALSSSATRALGPEAFYKAPNWLTDVAVGNNGVCTPPVSQAYFCNGELGYDGPTGFGTPNLTPSPGKPVVVARVDAIGPYEAKLEGTVNPEGSETKYHFEYGPTTSYGSALPEVDAGTGSGTTNVTVSREAYALLPEQLYHYRLVATNSKGTTRGEDHTFRTTGPQWAPKPTFSTTFGSFGEGDGQFGEGPIAVGVDPRDGSLWALDSGNIETGGDRLEKFSEKGEFLLKAGSKGTGDAQFEVPEGLDVDFEGNVWVADTFNNRIQEFNGKGEFIRKFGSLGTESGQFNHPGDVAVDRKGNVWVTDINNKRVQKFSSTGTYLSSFATSHKSPRGIAIDAKGNIWTDTGTGFLEKHNESGVLILSVGGLGSAFGKLEKAHGLTVDARGNVWVCNYDDNLFDVNFARIDVFSETGTYEESFGEEGVGSTQFLAPNDVSLDPRGNVWIADAGNSRVSNWKVPSPWPPTYASNVGSSGSGDGQFKAPTGTAISPVDGSIAVADYENNRIQVINENGEFIRKFGSAGTADGQFSNPVGVAFDSSGNVWVADTGNNRIQEFNGKGEFIRKFGSAGSGDGQLSFPSAVALDSKGNVWVADGFNKRVQEFTGTGTYVQKFKIGSGTYGVAIDSHDNVWNDSESGYVEERSPTGELIRKFAGLGSANGQLWHPRGLAIDASGDVWVVDNFNNRIEVFSERGEYLTAFGTQGIGSEQVNYPFGIALDPRGYVWIGDEGNNRIDRWKMG